MSSSSDDEEDYRKFNRRANKNKPKQQMPADLDAMMFSQDIAQKLLKERGFDITEEELGFKVKQKPIKQTNYVPIVDKASLKELQRDFNKIENLPQLCTILKALSVHPEANQEMKTQYAVLRSEFLMRNKQFEDVKQCSLELLNNSKELTLLQKVRLLISLGKAQLESGQTNEAIMQALRLRSYIEDVKLAPVKIEQVSIYDPQAEQVLQQIEDTCQIILSRTQRESKININLIGIQGNSNTGGLGLGELSQCSEMQYISILRNRTIIQIACGEHHVLALVSGCSCINPFKHQVCSGEKCNLGYEVIGWGENFMGQVTMDSTSGNFINQPHIVNTLSQQHIIGVAAYKCTSMAYNANGDIYQWGVEYPQFSLKDIIQLKIGNQFVVALTKQKQVYIIGNINSQKTNSPLLKFNKITHIPTEKPIQQIACGEAHIIALDVEGNVYGIGSNLYSQLGHPNKEVQFLKEFAILSQITECFNISANENASVLVTAEGELLYFGQITPNKLVDYPKSNQPDDDCQLIQAECHNGQIYCLNLRGKVYRWQPDSEPKFKLFMSGQIRQLYLCRGIRILQSTTLKGEWTRVELATEQAYTYENIEILINLGDQFGPYGFKAPHPVRYNLFITQEQKIDLEQLKSKSITITQMKQQNEYKIYLNQISDNLLLKSSIEQNDVDKHTLFIQVKDPGTYFVYLFLNEELCIDCPLQLEVEVGTKADELAQQQTREEEKRLFQLEQQKKEQLKKQQEEELRRQRQEQIQEEEKLKKLETKKRAEVTLQNHSLKQAEERRLKEEERQLKKDMLTGGGFDLKKVKQPIPINGSKLLNIAQVQKIKQQFNQEMREDKISSGDSDQRKKDFKINTNLKPGSQPPNQRILNPVKATNKVIQTVNQMNKKEKLIAREQNISQKEKAHYQTQELFRQDSHQDQFRKTESQLEKIQQELRQDFKQLKQSDKKYNR